MNRQALKWTTFIAGAAASFVCTASMMSSAAPSKWTRKSATECMVINGVVQDSDWNIKNNGTTLMQVLCPATDSNGFTKAEQNIVNVHGRDGHSTQSVTARTCASFAFGSIGGVGGACSVAKSSPAAGQAEYRLEQLSTTAWDRDVTDFGYTFVELPAKDGASLSTLRGVYTADQL